jgi:hypothetical protein
MFTFKNVALGILGIVVVRTTVVMVIRAMKGTDVELAKEFNDTVHNNGVKERN